jgi:hypothetical protein
MDRTTARTFIGAVRLSEQMILRFMIDHLRDLQMVGTWLLARGYLATSVDYLVEPLLANYVREVAKALPATRRILCVAGKNAQRARLTALG